MMRKISCGMVGIKILTYDGVTMEDAKYIVYKLWGGLEKGEIVSFRSP